MERRRAADGVRRKDWSQENVRTGALEGYVGLRLCEDNAAVCDGTELGVGAIAPIRGTPVGTFARMRRRLDGRRLEITERRNSDNSGHRADCEE